MPVILSQIESGLILAKLLIELLKVYNLELIKYRGKEYNILNVKLQVFYNSATAFKAARFLKDISAYIVWDTLRVYQINTYLGPLYNARKNFISIEFKQLINLIATKKKKLLVEAYNSIGLVK